MPFLIYLYFLTTICSTITFGENVCSTGRRQSPIEIFEDNVRSISGKTEYTNYDARVKLLIKDIHNITIDKSQEVKISMTIDDQTEETPAGPYVLDHIHFHTGCSEHLVNNKRYSLELHMVHYKSTYGSLNNAKNYEDGVVVMAVLFQEAKGKDNTALRCLLRKMDNADEDCAITLNEFLPPRRSQYFAYKGSLTTGDCAECVHWVVFRKPVFASYRQLEKVKKWNVPCRDTQSLNGRPVYMVDKSPKFGSHFLLILISLVVALIGQK